MTLKIIGQNSFTAGEIAPSLYSRAETGEYKAGLETATNCLVTSQGPVERRNGSKFIAEVKDSSALTRCIHYQISSNVAFTVEVGNLYMRFFTNNGQVTESDLTITGITAANPGVVTSTGHNLSNGDHVYISGVAGMTEVNSLTVPYLVANKTANTFELQTLAAANVDTSAYTAYSSGGVINRIYEIVSPYTTAQIPNVQFKQRGSAMYLTHEDVPQRTLVRTSNTDWALEAISFFPPATYESGYLATGFTITPSATTGIDKDFTSSSAIFLEGDIGRQIINDTVGETGRASIISITSTTVAVCDIVEDFTDTNAIASADWHIDLTPVVNIEFDSLQAGSVANIRSEHPAGSLGKRVAITGITAANPAVVTASGHGLIDGDDIQIHDVVGMSQLNDKTFTIENVSGTTFELKGEDSTAYTTYASGGIIRKSLSGVVIDAFRAADVGKYILASGGVAQILTINAADDIDVEIIKSLNTLDSTGNWSLEVPTWDATRGYPRAVGFAQERLIYGGSTAEPEVVWASEIGIFDGFGVGADDEDAIQLPIVSDQANEITWISTGREIVVGTTGGEVTLSSGSTTALTPSNVIQKARTPHGSAVQQVVNVRDEIIFIQNSARKIRTFRYDFNSDGYTGEDITYLAEHITAGGIKELAYAEEPDTIIYAVTNNGEMLAATYDRPKKVIGFTRFTTDGLFESVTTISKGEEDQVWVIVQRTVNGVTKRFMELFLKGEGEDDTDGFSDSYLTLSNPVLISNITAANPAVVTATSHGYSDGDTIIIKDLLDPLASTLTAGLDNMTTLNDCSFVVANKTTNTFELTSKDTSLFNAYGSAGNTFVKSTVISGLDHLEGKAVQIKVDGSSHAEKTVSSGAVTLDSAAGEVVIGLPYNTTIKTLGHEFDIGAGSMQGQKVRWARPLMRVYKSARPTVNGEYLPARNTADAMGKKIPLYSGFLEYGGLKWDTTSALTISLDYPLPLKISGITGTVESEVK